MPHFLINTENVSDNIVKISDKELYKHIIRVLRKKTGENIKFLDENEIQYESVISNITPDYFECEIKKRYQSLRKLNLNLYVAQCVLNSDAQISSVQKAVELGVKGIIPVYSENCAIKKSVIDTKTEKWQKVALESVKQCERADIPKVFDCMTLKEAVKDFDRVIVFAEKYADKNFFEYAKEQTFSPEEKILVVIGPEGGFSENEFEFFKSSSFPLITLGNLIYRADTALTAALTSVINGVLYVR